MAIGDSRSKRTARALAPPSHLNTLGAKPAWDYMFPGRRVGGAEHADAELVMSSLFQRQFAGPARPPLDDVVLSLGGNSLTTQVAPQAVVHNYQQATRDVEKNIKWILAGLAGYAAPQSKIVVLSPVPLAHLSDAGLAAYRRLSDILRGAAAELAPRCSFLDVERLLAAERSAPDSWRRPSPHHLPGAAVRVAQE